MSKLAWWPLSVYIVAAVLLVPSIGLRGFLGVALVAMAYRDSHEHFKHREAPHEV